MTVPPSHTSSALLPARGCGLATPLPSCCLFANKIYSSVCLVHTYSRDAVLAGGRPHPDQSSAAISTMSGQAVPRSRFQRPHRRLIVCASRHLSTPRAHSNRSAVGVRGAGGGVSLRRRLQKQIVKQVHYRPQQALAPASCSDPRQGGGGEGEGGYWWVGDGASDKAGELAPHWQIHPGRGRAGRRSR